MVISVLRILICRLTRNSLIFNILSSIRNNFQRTPTSLVLNEHLRFIYCCCCCYCGLCFCLFCILLWTFVSISY